MNVNGFFIEISRSAANDVPDDYVRRQTLKNNERFITNELKQHEEKVLSAQSKFLALEKRLYDELFDLVLPDLEKLFNANSLPANIPINTNVVDIGMLLYCLK